MSPKLNFHKNWNVTKTEMSPKLKYYLSWNDSKSKNDIKFKSKSKSNSRRSALIILVLYPWNIDHGQNIRTWEDFVVSFAHTESYNMSDVQYWQNLPNADHRTKEAEARTREEAMFIKVVWWRNKEKKKLISEKGVVWGIKSNRRWSRKGGAAER